MSDLELGFGADVLVRGETIRVMGKRDERTGVPVLRQVGHERRFVKHSFKNCTAWPGEPIGTDLEPAPTTRRVFEVTPEFDERPHIRLRRLLYDRAQIGIVIGFTWRDEGVVVPGYVSGEGEQEPAYLDGPGRKINLYEVALTPPPNGKARIVLAYPSDVAHMTAIRATA